MDRSISKDAIISAGTGDVWQAWTTSEGCKTFFAPDAHIELKEGGAFELYFRDDVPRGLQGSEGCTIIEFTPEQHLAFTWNAPPEFPEVRGQHTRVDVRLQPLGEEQTRVTLHHTGWREGDDWNQVFNFFDRAWDEVMRNLKVRFATGPVEWSDPSDDE